MLNENIENEIKVISGSIKDAIYDNKIINKDDLLRLFEIGKSEEGLDQDIVNAFENFTDDKTKMALDITSQLFANEEMYRILKSIDEKGFDEVVKESGRLSKIGGNLTTAITITYDTYKEFVENYERNGYVNPSHKYLRDIGITVALIGAGYLLGASAATALGIATVGIVLFYGTQALDSMQSEWFGTSLLEEIDSKSNTNINNILKYEEKVKEEGVEIRKYLKEKLEDIDPNEKSEAMKYLESDIIIKNERLDQYKYEGRIVNENYEQIKKAINEFENENGELPKRYLGSLILKDLEEKQNQMFEDFKKPTSDGLFSQNIVMEEGILDLISESLTVIYIDQIKEEDTILNIDAFEENLRNKSEISGFENIMKELNDRLKDQVDTILSEGREEISEGFVKLIKNHLIGLINEEINSYFFNNPYNNMLDLGHVKETFNHFESNIENDAAIWEIFTEDTTVSTVINEIFNLKKETNVFETLKSIFEIDLNLEVVKQFLNNGVYNGGMSEIRIENNLEIQNINEIIKRYNGQAKTMVEQVQNELDFKLNEIDSIDYFTNVDFSKSFFEIIDKKSDSLNSKTVKELKIAFEDLFEDLDNPNGESDFISRIKAHESEKNNLTEIQDKRIEGVKLIFVNIISNFDESLDLIKNSYGKLYNEIDSEIEALKSLKTRFEEEADSFGDIFNEFFDTDVTDFFEEPYEKLKEFDDYIKGHTTEGGFFSSKFFDIDDLKDFIAIKEEYLNLSNLAFDKIYNFFEMQIGKIEDNGIKGPIVIGDTNNDGIIDNSDSGVEIVVPGMPDLPKEDLFPGSGILDDIYDVLPWVDSFEEEFHLDVDKEIKIEDISDINSITDLDTNGDNIIDEKDDYFPYIKGENSSIGEIKRIDLNNKIIETKSGKEIPYIENEDPEESLPLPTNPDEISDIGDQINTPDSSNLDNEDTVRLIDPLIFDLNGDGVKTLGLDSGVNFDHFGNGFKENTGWASKNDAFLALDLNENGLIDSGAELFGNATIIGEDENGNPVYAENGFEALAYYDENNDGVIDNKDSIWSDLKLWKDSNSDGQSNKYEYYSLENFGISSISLGYIDSTEDAGNGNSFVAKGTYTTVDGETKEVGSLNFLTDQASGLLEEIEISDDVANMPNTHQIGLARNLQEAMMLSEDLKSTVQEYLLEEDKTARYSLLDKILYFWSETSTFDSYEERHKESNEEFFGMLNDGEIKNIDKIGISEIFSGKLLTDIKPDTLSRRGSYPEILSYYEDLKNYVYKQLESQTSLKEYIPSIENQDFEGLNLMLLEHSDKEAAAKIAIDLKSIYKDSMKNYNVIDFIKNKLYTIEEIPASILGELKKEGLIQLEEGESDFILTDNEIDSINFLSEDQENAFLESREIHGNELDNKIQGNQNEDVILGNSGSDILYGHEGDDKLYGGEGDDFLYGGKGKDYLNGGSGDDILGGDNAGYLGSDNETYLFEDNGDIFEGGQGNDVINDTIHSDTIIYNLGDGHDIINLSEVMEKGSNAIESLSSDKIVFGEGISVENFSYNRNNNDLIININIEDENAGSLTLKNWYKETNSSYKIESFIFSNGSILSWNEINDLSLSEVLTGTESSETIRGISGEINEINGMSGNDSLYGKEKNDYLFGEDGNDKLYGEDGNDLLYGEEGNDSLYGHEGNDILHGGSGNDILNGGFGKDQLYGGDGDDHMGNSSHDSGSASRYDENLFDNGDIFVGGKGDDKIYDTKHSDTIIYNLGDGEDTIYLSTEKENLSGDGRSLRQDKLVFGEGISLENLTFEMSGNDLIIFINKGLENEGSIEIDNFLTNKNIELFEFNNGEVYTGLEFLQIAKDFVYQGSIGNDSIYGQETNDVINGNLGNDTIYSRDGDDTIYGGEGSDRLYGEEGEDSIYGQENDDQINGEEGNDSLYGGSGNDTLSGGNDNDLLSGDNDNDHLYGNQGDDILYGGSGNDILAGGVGKDQLYGGDGDDHMGNSSHDSGSDSRYDENLFDNGDIIVGGKGDDKIYDTKHSDTIIYNLGDGDDTIYLSTEKENLSGDGRSLRQDKLVFGEGISLENLTFKMSGNDLTILINEGLENEGSIEIDNFLIHKNIELFEFDNGEIYSGLEFLQEAKNSIFKGTIENDSIYGQETNDIINGNLGNDTIYSRDGDDTIYGGEGSDRIYGEEGNDTLYGQENDDQIYGENGKDSIYGGSGNDSLYGDNDDDQLYGQENDDQIYGGNGADILYGGSGNDILAGGAGKDQLYGGDGDDHMGNSSHDSGSDSRYDENLFDNGDIIVGGKGDDKIYDTKHSDTIIYNLGDGNDTIDLSEEKENLSGDGRSLRQDKLIFGEGINKNDLSFEKISNNLLITLTLGGSLEFKNWFSSNDSSRKIEIFEFSNNEKINWKEINSIFEIESNIENENNLSDSLTITGTINNDNVYGKDGHDTLYGQEGNDRLYGKEGNDSLYGENGADTLYGENGNDILYGGSGNDTLRGGTGKDQLYGGDGNDTIGYNGFDSGSYSREDENLFDNGDIIVGGKGDDRIYDTKHSDTIIYNLGDGNDTIYLSTEKENLSGDGRSLRQDKLVFGEGISLENLTFKMNGNDLTIFINEGLEDEGSIEIDNFLTHKNIELFEFDNGEVYTGLEFLQIAKDFVYQGSIGNDSIYGQETNDVINGNLGNDTIYSKDGDDTIYGGEGSDRLYGEEGNDSLYGQEDNDSLYGNDGNDSLYGESGKDILYGNDGNDVLHGGEGNDTLYGENGNDLLQGGEGDDTLKGGTGKDQLYGGDGNDTIGYNSFDSGSVSREDENYFDNGDVLVGGKGNDRIYDTKHSDTIIYNLGDGDDTIYLSTEKENLSGDGRSLRQDKLVFGEGISLENLTFKTNGNDLIIFINEGLEDEGSIEIDNFLIHKNIELFEFDNGEIYSGLEFLQEAKNSIFKGTIENDSIYGQETNDVINGNLGNDTIYSRNGDDTIYGGEGSDRLYGEEGNDLLYGQEDNDSLYGNDGNDSLYGESGKDILYGNDGNDAIHGGEGNDTLYGENGNDLLQGGEGDDTLRGGTGKDQLYGGDGNDTIGYNSFDSGSYLREDESYFDNGDIIVGGKGDDRIYDTKHSDTIIYNLGDGNDTIYLSTEKENLSGDGRSLRQDKLVFGEGISLENITFKINGNDLIIFINEGLENEGSIEIDNFLIYKNIELFQFENGNIYTAEDILTIISSSEVSGTSERDIIFGSDISDDVILGKEGNDYLKGNNGSDKLFGDSGEDDLYGGEGDDSLFGGEDDDNLSGDQGNDYLDGGEGNDIITGGYGKDTLKGGQGDDTLGNSSSDYKGSSNETYLYYDNGNTYEGGKGDDIIYDTFHSDTIIYNLGDGSDKYILSEKIENVSEDKKSRSNDKFIFGKDIDKKDISFAMIGLDLIININIPENEATLTFENWFENLNDSSHKIEEFIFENGDVINWEEINDLGMYSEIEGTENEDNISGNQEVKNRIFGLSSDDILNGSNLRDELYGGEGNDVLDGGFGSDLLDGGKGNDILGNKDEESQEYRGNAGVDYKDIESGNTYIGGEGDDIIYETYHADTIIYNLGDGNDVIHTTYVSAFESGLIPRRQDNLVFGEGINKEDLKFTKLEDNSLLVTIKEGDDLEGSITIKNWFVNFNTTNSSYKIEKFTLFNGEELTWKEITEQIIEESLMGTASDDHLEVLLDQESEMNGFEGNDEIKGSTKADTIYGGEGNDTIYGGYGSNTIVGGTHNDNIISESTTDTIVYNLGDGNDTIKVLLPENTEDNSTKILFGELITKDDLSFEEIDNDLVIRVFEGTENEGSLTIKNWSTNENTKIENFEFSDGTSLTISDFTIGSEEIDISDDQVDSLTQEMSTFGIGSEETISDLMPKIEFNFIAE